MFPPPDIPVLLGMSTQAAVYWFISCWKSDFSEPMFLNKNNIQIQFTFSCFYWSKCKTHTSLSWRRKPHKIYVSRYSWFRHFIHYQPHLWHVRLVSGCEAIYIHVNINALVCVSGKIDLNLVVYCISDIISAVLHKVWWFDVFNSKAYYQLDKKFLNKWRGERFH